MAFRKYQHWGNLAGTKWCQVIATLDQCWCCRHLSPHYHHRYLSGCPNCPNCELADRALNEISHKFSQYSAMASSLPVLLHLIAALQGVGAFAACNVTKCCCQLYWQTIRHQCGGHHFVSTWTNTRPIFASLNRTQQQYLDYLQNKSVILRGAFSHIQYWTCNFQYFKPHILKLVADEIDHIDRQLWV